MASVMYGSGFCACVEARRLRVKDVDFARGELTVRDGKGQKDRMTVLPGGIGWIHSRDAPRTFCCWGQTRLTCQGNGAGAVASP